MEPASDDDSAALMMESSEEDDGEEEGSGTSEGETEGSDSDLEASSSAAGTTGSSEATSDAEESDAEESTGRDDGGYDSGGEAPPETTDDETFEGGDDTSGGDTSGGDTSGDDTSGDDTSAEVEATTEDDGSSTSTDVPDVPYCAGVADWDPEWVALEEDVLAIVNEVRAAGANCGSSGQFDPAGPLSMNPELRCAARVHSEDMVVRDFFDHTNPDGESPFDRMEAAGYSFRTAGENIAGGSADAEGTMQQWMESDGHCANIMHPDFTEIGVGYYPGGRYRHMWTQAFGG